MNHNRTEPRVFTAPLKPHGRGDAEKGGEMPPPFPKQQNVQVLRDAPTPYKLRPDRPRSGPGAKSPSNQRTRTELRPRCSLPLPKSLARAMLRRVR